MQSIRQPKQLTLEFTQEISGFVTFVYIIKDFTIDSENYNEPKVQKKLQQKHCKPTLLFAEIYAPCTGEQPWQHLLVIQILLRLSQVTTDQIKDETNTGPREFFTLLTQRYVTFSTNLLFTRSVIKQGRKDFFHIREEINEV